jgi:Mrp family chromosome partitioning ATPase
MPEHQTGEGARKPKPSQFVPGEEEQLRTLVQQLFFRPEFPPIRHVALAAPDRQTDLAQLGLNIAKVLAEDESQTVGVIDADTTSVATSMGLRNVPGSCDAHGTEIAARLWAVPLEGWRHELDASVASDQNLYRLRQVASEFDFSLLTCPPVSWLTARIAQACDGVVLVVTANKTRRLVAAQMRDHLRSAGIPVLGSVLAGRRFPVPQGLYRKL